MKNMGHYVALAALLGATPLQAAPDTGLVLHDTGIGKRETGIGATVGLRIKLGPDRVVKRSERVNLGIAAGPVMVLPDSTANNGVRRGQTSFVGFEMQPGYSTSFNVAGKPVFTDYTRLGAAENDNEDEDEQNTGDKIAWVAAVAGGVMVVLIGAVALHCSQQEGGSCSE